MINIRACWSGSDLSLKTSLPRNHLAPEGPQIYCYKLTTDNNGAPCVTEELLSLAICKPMIRRTAQEGALLFGFAANSLDRHNRLIYVAQLSQPITNGEYYTRDEYRHRPDCIYQKVGDGFRLRSNSQYHWPEAKHIERDLGRSHSWNRTTVLVSKNFRYLGGRTPFDYRERYPKIRIAVQQLRSGHLINHSKSLREEFIALKQDLWSQFCGRQIWGESSEPAPQRAVKTCQSRRQNCRSLKRIGHP